jgi:hypothetical protein
MVNGNAEAPNPGCVSVVVVRQADERIESGSASVTGGGFVINAALLSYAKS